MLLALCLFVYTYLLMLGLPQYRPWIALGGAAEPPKQKANDPNPWPDARRKGFGSFFMEESGYSSTSSSSSGTGAKRIRVL